MGLTSDLDWQLVRACDVVADPDCLPAKKGVYVIAGKALIPALHAWGYYDFAGSCHRFIDGEPVLYVGSSNGLDSSVKKRVLSHLDGDCRKSTFRQSLGLLLAQSLALRPIPSSCSGGFHFGEGEGRLSQWVQTNLMVGFETSVSPIASERTLMRETFPPLNIKEREWDPFARYLSAQRQAFRPIPKAEMRRVGQT